MTPLFFIILCMAAHRLSLMLSKEIGPGFLFRFIRREVKKKAPKKTALKEGIDCPWCVSVWFGALLAIGVVVLADNFFFMGVLLALAISDGAVILNQAFTRDDK